MHCRFQNGQVTAVYYSGDIVIDRTLSKPGDPGHPRISPVWYSRAILDQWSAAELAALDIVPITRQAAPAFDPLTQRLALNAVQVGAAAPEETWTIEALDTAQQIQVARDGRRRHIRTLDVALALLELIRLCVQQLALVPSNRLVRFRDRVTQAQASYPPPAGTDEDDMITPPDP